MIRAFILIICLLTASCIGTDIVEEVTVPEVFNISSAVSSLKVGESYHFMAEYFDAMGMKSQVSVNWSSIDPTIIEIDNQGIATALMEGNTIIVASYDGLRDSVMVEAGTETVLQPDTKTGSFQGRSDYVVEGDFNLSDDNGTLMLNFSSNFSASNGPGLHVYLSNQSTNVAGGIDLGELKQNSGAQEYTLPNDVSINTYNYVIIYCKPFSVVFGFGQLE